MKFRLVTASLIPMAILGLLAAQDSEAVLWSAKLGTMQPVSPGQEIILDLDAKIAPGWRVYSISEPARGPRRTKISVPNGQLVRLNGDVIGPPPQSSYDPVFSTKTEFYERSVTFKVPLIVVPTAKAGPTELKINVLFQACNGQLCLPPATVGVPFKVTISRAPKDCE